MGAVEALDAIERDEIEENFPKFHEIFFRRNQFFNGFIESTEKVEIGDHDGTHIENDRRIEMDGSVPRHHEFVRRRFANECLVVGMPYIKSRNDRGYHAEKDHPVVEAHKESHALDTLKLRSHCRPP